MNKMPHIQLDGSVNATAAILPGDPARVDAIATFLTDVKEEGFSREYKSITGTYKGHRILAISTGMGGASTAICVEAPPIPVEMASIRWPSLPEWAVLQLQSASKNSQISGFRI